MKAMKKAVLATAKEMLKANNSVTTLEIKVQLRRDYPYYYWDQATVSTYMLQFSGDGTFDYTDNGTYRTYFLPKKNTVTTKTSPAITTSVTKKLLSGITYPSNKTITKTISRHRLLSYILDNYTGITSVVLSNGKTVTKQDISNQKKSLKGYVVPKLHSLLAVKLGKNTVTVKN